jgi:hypothetical protein
MRVSTELAGQRDPSRRPGLHTVFLPEMAPRRVIPVGLAGIGAEFPATHATVG